MHTKSSTMRRVQQTGTQARGRAWGVTIQVLFTATLACTAEVAGDVPTDAGEHVDLLPQELTPGTPANAEPSCMRSNSRIWSKEINSIYDAWGNYHGWAEWRQGSSGSCRGWQWVRVHITSSIDATKIRYVNYGTSRADMQENPRTEYNWSNGLWPARHEGPLLHALSDKICAYFYSETDDKSGIYFFGHGVWKNLDQTGMLESERSVETEARSLVSRNALGRAVARVAPRATRSFEREPRVLEDVPTRG